MLNSVIDDIARNVDDEDQKGLKRCEILDFCDKNSLEAWPLSKLASKCTNMEYFKIQDLDKTTEDNCSKLLEFGIQVCSKSIKL